MVTTVSGPRTAYVAATLVVQVWDLYRAAALVKESGAREYAKALDYDDR